MEESDQNSTSGVMGSVKIYPFSDSGLGPTNGDRSFRCRSSSMSDSGAIQTCSQRTHGPLTQCIECRVGTPNIVYSFPRFKMVMSKSPTLFPRSVHLSGCEHISGTRWICRTDINKSQPAPHSTHISPAPHATHCARYALNADTFLRGAVRNPETSEPIMHPT